MQRTRQKSLLFMLISLTLLFLVSQVSFFLIYYKSFAIIDTVAQSSLSHAIFNSALLLPLMGYFILQLVAYACLIIFVWFVTQSIRCLFHLSDTFAYWFGLCFWMLIIILVLSLNAYYFPHSSFSIIYTLMILRVSVAAVVIATLLAYLNFFMNRDVFVMGSLFLLFAAFVAGFELYQRYYLLPALTPISGKPNVIIIGLDSLRPDAINRKDTPAIYHFLASSHTFTRAYTPLARTFPSWVSLLTATYPKKMVHVLIFVRQKLSSPRIISSSN